VGAIKRLLASGAKVDAKDQSGVTPLFVAAVFGRTNAAELLVKMGKIIVPLLKKRANDPDPEVRHRIEGILGQTAPKNVAPVSHP